MANLVDVVDLHDGRVCEHAAYRREVIILPFIGNDMEYITMQTIHLDLD